MNLKQPPRSAIVFFMRLADFIKCPTTERSHQVVGGGINDAPALAQADVGIAMGAAGTDAAIEAAHVALMRDDRRAVPEAGRLGRRAFQTIKQNLWFTATYNLIGMLLAAPGRLPPIAAAAAQSLPELLNCSRQLTLGEPSLSPEQTLRFEADAACNLGTAEWGLYRILLADRHGASQHPAGSIGYSVPVLSWLSKVSLDLTSPNHDLMLRRM